MILREVHKRLYLDLKFIQGEQVSLEFSISEDGDYRSLGEFVFTGNVSDKNNKPLLKFNFGMTEDDNYWLASIKSVDTLSLKPDMYTYEIKGKDLMSGKIETILYGTMEIVPTRIGTI